MWSFWWVGIVAFLLVMAPRVWGQESSGIFERSTLLIRNGLEEYSLTASAMVGGAVDLRSEEGAPDHNLALTSLQVARDISGSLAESKWYEGHWRLAGEIFC